MNGTQPAKVRFDGLDVLAIVASLQRTCVGQRVVNIYDDTSNENTSFVFKMENKQFLLVEAGIRFHGCSNRNESNKDMPTPFCAKLRKHLRGLRLEQVVQLGQLDRVVLFKFGLQEQKFALILELYSRGNLILTDGNTFNILALLRSHVYNSNNKDNNTESVTAQVQVGHVYPVAFATQQQESKNTILKMSAEQFSSWMDEVIQSRLVAKSSKKKQACNLKMILLLPSSGVSQYGPALIEHCICKAALDPHESLIVDGANKSSLSTEDCERLLRSLQNEGSQVINTLKTPDMVHQGYILYRAKEANGNNSPEDIADVPHSDKILLEFQPYLYHQHAGMNVLEYPSFEVAVQDFFRHIVWQKISLKEAAATLATQKRLEKIRKDQAERLQGLFHSQEILYKQAEAVQQHADHVDKALVVINSALDSGMDWDQLQDLVAVEKKRSNPIAQIISKLDLEHDLITMALPGEDGTIEVPINLKESAHANASSLFAKYRLAKEKAQKTIDATSKALDAAEQSASRQLEEVQKRSKQAMMKRKTLWFEKFLWFITSDNYLVLAGRDAHQNELLVKRYLRPGDAYLHADVHGAASCVLRAKRRRIASGATQAVPLSQRALVEAGQFTVCRSSAWSKKMVVSAWWVESEQVSKTAPTGEFLTTGSFMIRGKKNFLPPVSPLEMGMAVLFRLGEDEDTLARHSKERRDFALIEVENSIEAISLPSSPMSGSHDDFSFDEKVNNQCSGEPEAPASINQIEATVSSTKPSIKEVSEGLAMLGDELVDAADQETLLNDEAPLAQDVERVALDATEAQVPSQEKKKGLSKKDRKLIKKYGSLEQANRPTARNGSATANDDANKALKVTDGLPSNKQQPLANSIVQASTRGKKGKQKKFLKKYADQDEEDRQLAMQGLQGGEKSKKKSGKQTKATISEAQEQVATSTAAILIKDPITVAEALNEEVRDILSRCVLESSEGPDDGVPSTVRWDKFDSGTLEQLLTLDTKEQVAAAGRLLHLKETIRVDNFSASLSGIIRMIRKYGYEHLDKSRDQQGEKIEGSKRKSKPEKEADALKWREALAEEGVPLFDEANDQDAIDDTAELNKLTGKPHPQDLILYAVPVCAPYQTLSQYTYRVKLTPGGMKRGKAAQQCLDLFVRDDNNKSVANHAQLKEYMKKVPENDWVQSICPDVKIATAGAAKMAKKNKSAKKKSQDEK